MDLGRKNCDRGGRQKHDEILHGHDKVKERGGQRPATIATTPSTTIPVASKQRNTLRHDEFPKTSSTSGGAEQSSNQSLGKIAIGSL